MVFFKLLILLLPSKIIFNQIVSQNESIRNYIYCNSSSQGRGRKRKHQDLCWLSKIQWSRDRWRRSLGLKKLAYPIQKKTTGIYHHVEFKIRFRRHLRTKVKQKKQKSANVGCRKLHPQLICLNSFWIWKAFDPFCVAKISLRCCFCLSDRSLEPQTSKNHAKP